MTSKTGYKPGPFGYYKDGDPLYPKHPWTITDTPNGGCDLAHAESEYIARYLAAAPEMVEALETARLELAIAAEIASAMSDPEHCLHTDPKHGYDWNEIKNRFKSGEANARAILAKIEGV